MSKRGTKFIVSWSEKYAWISKDKNCIHCARYTFCSALGMVVFQTWINALKLQSTLKLRNRWDHSARFKQGLFFNRMFQTCNERPHFECRNLAGSKHGGWKSLVLFREWWQWQVQKAASGLTNCCKIFSRRNKTQICCSIWSRSLCWGLTDYWCTKNSTLL